MALRNILGDDDPYLVKKSRAVTDFNERLHTLLDDMRMTLINAHGLGLAAPQVGVLRRAVLVVEPADEDPDNDDADTGSTDLVDEDIYNERIVELINPMLIFSDGEQCGSEGCLSMPGVFGLVTRPAYVKVKAHDRYGEEFIFEASDMTARAVCHEIDHLDGILFTSIAERLLTPQEVEEMRNQGTADNKTGQEDEVI